MINSLVFTKYSDLIRKLRNNERKLKHGDILYLVDRKL